MSKSTSSDPSQSQSTLIRGFLIMQEVVKSDKPTSSAFIAEVLDLPKATVHRIAQQLEEEGILEREPGSKRFIGGRRLREMARMTLTNSVINANRHAILRALSEEVDETCNLTALDGNEIIYLDRVETNWPYRIHLPIGSHLPLHCTATGKLFLAHMKKAQRQRMLFSLPLKAYTDKSITEPNTLEAQLNEIAREAVGVDTGEYLEGMISISVPVFDRQDNMCFGLAIHAPSARKTVAQLRDYLPALRRAARRMGDDLIYK